MFAMVAEMMGSDRLLKRDGYIDKRIKGIARLTDA